MSDSQLQELRRKAATGDERAQQSLQRLQDRSAQGPYCHLEGQDAVFVDDYSHYCGTITAKFSLPDGYLFHAEPCYQVSRFKDDGPEYITQIDNGPVVLDSRRFKIITRQPMGWQDGIAKRLQQSGE